jgi:hypothetical protein
MCPSRGPQWTGVRTLRGRSDPSDGMAAALRDAIETLTALVGESRVHFAAQPGAERSAWRDDAST